MSLAVCWNCRHKGPIVAGQRVVCTKDGKPIDWHAATKECPEGLFDAPKRKPPPLPVASDDEIEAMLEVERKVGGCGCAGGYSDVTRPK